MAKNHTVWGIDIGNTSLKALRCRLGTEPGTIEALSFDYIEHSKILTQAGADAAELMGETLNTFLSRNSIKKDKIAITVTGQNTISRFLKLPPFDKKKLKDIISYEAKLWLPFALEDVVWDYQPLAGGSMQGNTMVDTEVGMFAIKREHTSRLLAPMDKAGIAVDCIQSSLMSLYNFATFDQMDFESLANNYDPRNPYEYVIILCPGTDSTDVVITNGIKIWVRNFPIGGNNFTKALTRGMKLTFSNAEHIKRNAATCQDPKAVFQAMRPVFNEFLTEVNRSIEFYSSLDRKARYSKILLLGNPAKLPGLREFLHQNLGYNIVKLSKFNKLVGDDVLSAPAFIENLGSFTESYGLAVQLLGESVIRTNLIPMDVVKERLVNYKKPWLLAGAAALMLGLVIQYTGVSTAYTSIDDAAMQSAQKVAESIKSKSGDLNSKKDSAVSEYDKFYSIGSNLTSNIEGRILRMELFKAINEALPRDAVDSTETELENKHRIYVSNIEEQDVTELSEWWEAAIMSQGAYVPDPEELEEIARLEAEGGASGSDGDSTSSSSSSSSSSSTSSSSSSSTSSSSSDSGATLKSDTEMLGLDRIPKPEGAGKIVQLTLYHYHNPMEARTFEMGAEYVRRTLCRNLKLGSIFLPVSLDSQIKADAVGQTEMVEVKFKDMGISHPVLLDYTQPMSRTIIDPAALQKLIIENTLKQQTTRQKGGTSSRGGMMGNDPMGGMGGSVSMMNTPGMATMSRDMSGLGMGGTNPMSLLGGGGGGGSMSPGGGRGAGAGGGGMSGMSNISDQLAGIPEDQKMKLTRFDCVVQFVWIPTPPTEREKKLEEKRKAEEEAAQLNMEESPTESEEMPSEQEELSPEGANETDDTIVDETAVEETIPAEPSVDETGTDMEPVVEEE